MKRNDTKKAPSLRAPGIRFGVVVSNFNGDITEPLLKGALRALKEAGVKDSRVTILRVPGSYEIPYGCLTLIRNKCKIIVALGCVIKGETEHDRYIASAVSTGLMQVSLEHRVPIAFGILTTNNLKQARARSSGTNNKGAEAARAALQMALLK